MARHFAGSASNFVDCSIGAFSSSDGGPFTIAAVVKLDGTRGGLFELRTSGGTTCVGLNTDSGQYFYSAGGFTTVMASSTADNWHLIAVTKDAGTVTPRGHKYVYDTDTWTHSNGAGTVNDASSTPGGTGVARLCRFPDSNNDNLNGDVDVMGAWNRALTDAEVEQLVLTISAWYASAPDGLWVMDQSLTTQAIIDATGNGANETTLTGTSVSTNSVPVLNYGDNVTYTQTVTSGANVVKNINDVVGVIDSATDTWALSRTVVDVEGSTDTASDAWQLARTVTNTVGVVDAASGSFGSLSRLVTDTVGIVDSVVASSVGPQSGARIRISGREPNNHISGREPNNRISGTEVATP